MTASISKKIERIEFRIEPELKKKIQIAAEFSDEKISDFILKRIMPEVERLIETERKVKLDQEAWDSFVGILQSPKPASKNLKSSMKEYLRAQKR